MGWRKPKLPTAVATWAGFAEVQSDCRMTGRAQTQDYSSDGLQTASVLVRCLKMKLKKLGIIVVAAAVLAIMTGGMASAYTWQDVDWSQLWSSSSATWYDNAYGSPTVAAGSYLTWQNTFANEYYGSSYYPTLFATRDGGVDTYYFSRDTPLAYHYAWAPDGGVDGGDRICASSMPGPHAITVYHYWGTGQGGTNVNANVQHFYSV